MKIDFEFKIEAIFDEQFEIQSKSNEKKYIFLELIFQKEIGGISDGPASSNKDEKRERNSSG